MKNRRANFIWKLGAALLLLALAVMPFLPGTANAVEQVENMYALVVTTGSDAGDEVTYFGLRYRDTQGYTHVEYLFPHKGGYTQTLDRAAGSGRPDNRLALLRQLGVTGSISTQAARPLQPGQTDTFFFEPAYEPEEILGLEVYCQGQQGQLYTWEVSGLRLYRVDRILGLEMDGYYANDFTVRFAGEQLAAMQERGSNGGATFSWTGNSLFRLDDSATAHQKLVFHRESYAMEAADQYVIRLDLADVWGAGLEQLNQPYNKKETLANAGFGEHMALRIEYLDSFGDPCVVTVPVITATLGWAVEQGVPSSSRIAGLAQQGDTIAFGCYLRDMHSVTAVTLYSGNEARDLVLPQVEQGESALFTGVSVYAAGQVGVGMSDVENSANPPEYIFSGNPLFYHTASTLRGEELTANGSHYMTLRPYEIGALLVQPQTQERYLVELLADETGITGVPEDLSINLQYTDLSGSARSSGEVSVREAAREYYGAWPASAGEFAYEGKINSAQGLRFVLELPDVEHFTGLTVSVPDGSVDWQLGGFRVVRLDTLSKRYCLWQDTVGTGTGTNRVYDRNAQGYLIFTMDEKVLIQPGDSYELSFISSSVQEVTDIDWSDMRYSMTFDQCSANLGLAKTRETYTVEVRVRSGTAALDGYGDNGSKNRFYFLLEFQEGVSGYVLANQQLGADGFRSGCTETFTVATNYDYGELVAVHVIPDDISEGSDPYDKLNVDQIRVRRADGGSLSREWVVDNVGWIGIDYRDDGAGASISGQKGRTEAEIARTYPVSYTTYALNLEFLLSTGVYSDSGSGGSFYGTIEGTLEYYNKDGKRNQMTFDLVRAMYDYANKSPVYLNDGTTGTSGEPLAVTDPSFMFRQNHTDRFVISVTDVVRVSKLTLNMRSLNGGSLQINNLSVALVTEAGRLQINDQDEYVRTGTTEFLCADTVDKVPAFELFLPTDRNIYQEIYFSEHDDIKLDTENNTWISAVTREPLSRNDTLNVYVYPARDASGNFDMDIRAQFTDVTGRLLESSAQDLNRYTAADGRTVYAVMGLGASGMSTLNRVYLKAQSPQVVDAYIDHVIVQQVRSGVVINTYYLDCEHRNADMQFYAQPGLQKVTTGEEQKVTLSFGRETESANLVPENRDVAVAIRYTTENDAGRQEYTSKFIYLTDQDYWAIQAGELVTLTFRESYVRDITGILVATTGNVKAQVDMACVDQYVVDAAGLTQQGAHTSFAQGAVTRNNTVLLEDTPNTSVQPLKLEFLTADADAYLESGTNASILMTLGYTDSQGVQQELVLEDLREYVTSQGIPFATGSVTTVELLVRDAAQLRWLQLIPYDQDPQVIAGWKLGRVNAALGPQGSLQTASRTVDTYLEEGTDTGRINLVNIVITGDVQVTMASGQYGNSYRLSSAASNALQVSALSGGTVRISNLTASNSLLGCVVTAHRISGGIVAQEVSSQLGFSEDRVFFTVPDNLTGEDMYYRITVTSAEVEELSVTVDILVPSLEPEAAEPTEPEATEPTEPEVTEPTEPEATDPTEPEVTDPTEPEATDPTEPTDPAEPEA